MSKDYTSNTLDSYNQDMLRFLVGSTLDSGWLETPLVDEIRVLPYHDDGPESGRILVRARVIISLSETGSRFLTDTEIELLSELTGEEVVQDEDGAALILVEENVPDSIYPEDIIDFIIEDHEGLMILGEMRGGEGLLENLSKNLP